LERDELGHRLRVIKGREVDVHPGPDHPHRHGDGAIPDIDPRCADVQDQPGARGGRQHSAPLVRITFTVRRGPEVQRPH